ncbi:MAG: hypothetical protein WBC01_12510, partial [Solirubrobacterales bacterium]
MFAVRVPDQILGPAEVGLDRAELEPRLDRGDPDGAAGAHATADCGSAGSASVLGSGAVGLRAGSGAQLHP